MHGAVICHMMILIITGPITKCSVYMISGTRDTLYPPNYSEGGKKITLIFQQLKRNCLYGKF